MKLNKRLKILILGIGGTGMNVLAQYLNSLGCIVHGTDRYFDLNNKARTKICLEKSGVIIKNDSFIDGLFDYDLIIKSPAIEKSHPYILEGIKYNIAIKKRSEYLIDIFNDYFSVGVTGTSGKTTITGMLSFMVNYTSDNYFCFVGDEILNWSSDDKLGNFSKGCENKMILEVDESEGNLNSYYPDIGIISTIDKDHFELNELMVMYRNFCNNSNKLILNIDNEKIYQLASEFKDKTFTVSSKYKNADYFYRCENINPFSCTFFINDYYATLQISGKHNILNASLSIAAVNTLGVNLEEAIKKLYDFKGISKRFEVRKKNESFFVFDYAHNTEKIKSSLLSAKSFGLPVIFIYQPHGYGPLKFMINELSQMFKDILSKEDILVLKKVYDAGGSADRTVQSSDLAKMIQNPNVFCVESNDEILAFSKTKANKSYTWVVSGARDPELKTLYLNLML